MDANDEKEYLNNLSISLGNGSTIFDRIKNGIAITNQDSMIVYTNPAFTQITGYTAEEVKGKNPGMLHSGQHTDSFYKQMWSAIVAEGFWEGEIWNRRKSGQIFPELLTISKMNQSQSTRFYYLSIFSDISFLKKDIDKKLHLAFYDPLTELPNRNSYLDQVNKTIENASQDKTKEVAIFYMDLDRFKQVNDTYGHCTGDKLLKMVGKRLASITRSSDTIARIGGDEFAAILASDSSKEFVTNYAKRILDHIEKPFVIDGEKIEISISIGISFFPSNTTHIETLHSYICVAMYKAKKTGSKIEFYHAGLAV